jgi:hypothetical protein
MGQYPGPFNLTISRQGMFFLILFTIQSDHRPQSKDFVGNVDSAYSNFSENG